MSSIARKYGFKDWKVLYDDPANVELKKRRPNPNVLYPGDLVAIPEARARMAQRSTGTWHDFAVEKEKARLKIQLIGLDTKPLSSHDYQLTVDGQQRYGTTDGSGVLDEPVDVKSSVATLQVTVPAGDGTRDLVWRLEIGSLDPTSMVSGLQARLANLQYYSGAIDGNFGPRTRGALAAFQQSAGLEPTGVPDETTLSKLEKQHDEVT